MGDEHSEFGQVKEHGENADDEIELCDTIHSLAKVELLFGRVTHKPSHTMGILTGL